MSLRNKTLLTVVITIICLTAILYVVSINLWLNSIAQVEKQYTLKDVERGLGAIDDSLANLESTANDWAAWDDTYDFVVKTNDDYIQSNLTEVTFANLRLNLMLFVNNEGQLVYGKAFDLQAQKEIPLPEGVSQILSSSQVVVHARIESVSRGIFDLPEGPMLLVSHPILNNDHHGPIHGSLIIGRYLDSVEIERLEQLTRLTLDVFQLEDGQLPPEVQEALASLQGGNVIQVAPQGNERVVGYTILNDIQGKPALILAVENSREIYGQAQNWLTWLLVAFVVAGLSSGIGIATQIDRMVLGRITKINHEVNVVTTAGTPTARVTVAGKDELAGLAENINNMLESLDSSRSGLYQAHEALQREVEERRNAEAALRGSEERYRTLLENVRIGVYRTTPGSKGKFLMANPAFLSMYGYDSEEELKQVTVASTYVIPAEGKGFSDQLLARGRVDGLELHLKRKDGSILLGSVTAVVAHDNKGTPYFDCTIEDITHRKQAERVQATLYQISQATLTASDLEELFTLVHQSISELIVANNFYVALYDPVEDMVSFPYFVDENDPQPAPRKMGSGLTEYLIHHGEPVLVSPELFAELEESGEVENSGTPCLDWLGVPLKTAEDKTIGALVVQTYNEGVRFDENDRDLLTIVSTQVALAIERKRGEEALRKSEARYRAVVEDQHELICRFDPQGTLTFVNDAYCRYFDKKRTELVGVNFIPLILEEDQKLIAEMEALISPQNPVVTYEHRVILPSGEIRWQQWSDHGIFDETGQLVEYQSVGRDITERKYAEEQLTHNAFHDSLTSLPNRSLFIDRLGHAIQRGKRHKDQWFAVLFLDLDRFKTVNDSLGHVLGDQLLISAARRLLACLRTSDTVARFGGDEFVILLEDLNSQENVIQISERILKEMAEPFILAGHRVVVTTSIGIVYSTHEYDRPEEVLRDADIAMYRAKELGRNRYVVFTSAMRAYVVEHLKLESDLRQAIEQEELDLHFQPIYSMKTNEIIGFEALVRWRHPTQGLLKPAAFIYLAEETGLIVPLGEWVLEQACRQMRAWRDQFPSKTPLTISVNLSTKQFSQPEFYSQVCQVLEKTGLEPTELMLEITESALMENSDWTINTLKQLLELGVKVHIDDFGTGYSSLIYLHMLPINAIKIDRSFISGPGAGSGGMEIVQTIIKLAHELKVETVAEGVETQEQYDWLKGLDCDYVQGFLLSQCLTAQETEELMKGTIS